METNRVLNTEIQYTHLIQIHNQNAAKEILPFVFSLVCPKSVLDLGCGTGSWLAVSKKLGVSTVRGIDGIHLDSSRLEIEEEDFIRHDLTKSLDLNEKYDLAISLEVAEHLPETAANNLIEILTAHSDVILFSAAIPGQGGQFHYNEQWPEYWNQLFRKKGYVAFDILRNKFWNNENVDWWYKQNMIIYAKQSYSDRLGYPSSNPLSIVHPQLYCLKLKEISLQRKAANRFTLFKHVSRLKNKLYNLWQLQAPKEFPL